MNFLSEIRGLQYCELLVPWQIELQASTAAVCFRDITEGIIHDGCICPTVIFQNFSNGWDLE